MENDPVEIDALEQYFENVGFNTIFMRPNQYPVQVYATRE